MSVLFAFGTPTHVPTLSTHPGPRRVRLVVSDWAGAASQGPRSPPRLFHCPRSLQVSLPPCPTPKVLFCCRILPGCVRGCGRSQERGHPLARAHVALCWRVAATLEGSPGRGLYFSAQSLEKVF